MGVAPASNVAQDLANALMWRLLACLDAASAPHVARLRRKYPEFDEAWRTRQQLAHDAYGSQARLASALDYTDDAMLSAMGPVASYLLLSEFAHMIAPRHMWAGCALDRVLDERRLAASVADSLARASVGASVPRLHGLGLEAAGPQKLWGGHAAPWTGAVLSGAYGAMWITHAKLLRTHSSAQRLLAGEMHVTDYRAFIGFIISLSACRVHDTYEMHGLWGPLQLGGELERGPNTIVECRGE